MRFLLLSLALSLAACTHEGTYKLPGVYRIDIQQGSIIDNEMLARLKPGMDKNQVQFIMGTPPLVDPFHTDRWDYVYTFSKGGRQRKQRHITLHFEDDKLAYVDGDVVPGLERPEELTNKPTKIVDVPLRKYKRRGFFSKLIDRLPFTGDGEAEEPPEQE
jgi:outer membrane protein assembly factor BamE